MERMAGEKGRGGRGKEWCGGRGGEVWREGRRGVEGGEERCGEPADSWERDPYLATHLHN